MATNLPRTELEGAIDVIESLRGRDFNALADEIRQRAQTLEAQLSPCYFAFLETSRATDSRLTLLLNRIKPQIANSKLAIGLHGLCIDLGIEALKIDLRVENAIVSPYLSLQKWIGSGSGQLAQFVKQTVHAAGRDAALSVGGLVPFPPVSMVASCASLSRAISTLSQATAKVDDLFGALQATAGALWALDVLESGGAEKLAALLDDAKNAMDCCQQAVTEVEDAAQNLATP